MKISLKIWIKYKPYVVLKDEDLSRNSYEEIKAKVVFANKIQEVFYDNQKKQINKLLPYFPKEAKILNVWAWLGFGGLYLKTQWYSVENLDVSNDVHPQLQNIVQIKLYNGKDLSVYKDKEFDIVLLTYVLHHVGKPHERNAFLLDLCRITKRIIIVDESWENRYQKLSLLYYDFMYNLQASWACNVYTQTYFKSGELKEILEKSQNKIVSYKEQKNPRGAYNLVFAVVDC